MEQASQRTAAAAQPTKTGVLRAVICTLLFLILAASLFIYLNKVVDYKGTNQTKGTWNAFYELPSDYIDVAYIGSSATSRYYNCPLSYEEEGIAVFDLGVNNTPIMFYDDIVREIQTTQSPDLFIFELRNLRKGDGALTEGNARFSIDSLKKLSPNRKTMIEDFLAYEEEASGGTEVNDSMINYYLPILRYHDRVLELDLTEEDFKLEEPYNTMQGFCATKVTVTQAPQSPAVCTSEVGELDPGSENDLISLLDFCDGLDAQALFVLSPYSVPDLDESAALNRIGQIIEERGYGFLNFNTQELYSVLDVDFSTDFYNKNHMNYLGSEKYTKYLATLIKERFDLEDHRGDATYDDYYGKGLKDYQKVVNDGIKYVADADVNDE